VAVEYDFASGTDGDTDINKKEFHTFDNLYPTNHLHYGYMDYQGWKNMQDIALKASAKPTDKCFVYLAYHMFSLAEKQDLWYHASGAVNPFATWEDDDVGQEIDLLARHTFNPNLKVEAGISQFFAGDVIKKTVKDAGGSVEDSTWAYLMGTVSF